MQSELQPELFDQFNEATPKGRGNLKSRQRFRRRVTGKILPPRFTFNLSYDKIIIATIALIMLIIVSFSLGVERGKRLVDSPRPPSTAPAIVKAEKPGLQEVKEKEIQPYAIQVVTFKRKALAEKEVSRLKKINYDSFFRTSGKFYLVFVGNYASKESAKQDLKKLRKIYKDCFIRRF